MFRPKSRSSRSTGENGPQEPRGRHGPGGPPPPSSSSEQQSFFGTPKFPFDTTSSSGGGGDLDDSGYFSEHADDAEANRFGPMKRNESTTESSTRFAHSTKRVRPVSPAGNDEDIVVMQQPSRDSDHLLKRPRVHRSSPPSRSHAPLSRTSSMLENARLDEGAPSFALPPHIPHPTAAMGELPGLEFSEADLARYAELYEQGSERWSKAPMDEWVAGADEVLAKFSEMIDMVSLYFVYMDYPITFTITDQGPYEVRFCRFSCDSVGFLSRLR